MTRLQKMLSRIKTVKELSEILNIPEDEIISEIAVAKNGRPMNCNTDNCSRCALHGENGCQMNYTSMCEYLADEYPETTHADTDSAKPNYSTEIIELRENARKSIMNYIHSQALKFGDPQRCAYILTHHITLLEGIGLFNKGELREQILEELNKKL